MFKTARMRKIRIVTLEKYVAPTVDALHESGLIQISDISDSIQQDPELAELVTPAKSTPYTGKLSSLLMKTNGISELLGNSLSEGHGLKDLAMSFISPDLPVQKEVERLDTAAFIEKAEDTLGQVEAKTGVIEEKLSALDAETSELQSNKSLANRLSNFDMVRTPWKSLYSGQSAPRPASGRRRSCSSASDRVPACHSLRRHFSPRADPSCSSCPSE